LTNDDTFDFDSDADKQTYWKSWFDSTFDFWKEGYNVKSKSFMTENDFDSAEEVLEQLEDSELLFNASSTKNSDNTYNYDCKVTVPSASFDYIKYKSIPIAPLVKAFMKHQIKTIIKNVCDKYIDSMTSIPELKTESD
jgi:hypothetical protein